LADGPAIKVDPVAGLIDIPLPGEVSLWPQTWEARIAMALLIVGAIAGVWRLLRYWHVNRYRRAALAELGRIGSADPVASPAQLAQLTVLVRRTALAAFPREEVAPLVGTAWLAFLDRSYGGHEFSEGTGRLLLSGPYQQMPPDDAELRSLVALVRRWVKVHHV
jgi:hypothetical protein